MGNKLDRAINRAAGALDLVKAQASLSRALHTGLCPQCGGALVRKDNALACQDAECMGLDVVRFRIKCAQAMVGA